jgi:hypothetical protein
MAIAELSVSDCSAGDQVETSHLPTGCDGYPGRGYRWSNVLRQQVSVAITLGRNGPLQLLLQFEYLFCGRSGTATVSNGDGTVVYGTKREGAAFVCLRLRLYNHVQLGLPTVIAVAACVIGEFFGELALITNEPRTASVRASDGERSLEVFTLLKHDFRRVRPYDWY